MLERMETIAPAHVDNPFSFRAPESLPNPLLKMEKVTAGYGERIIFDAIKLNLVPGSRIGLLGRNGTDKSTLIKLLAGELTPLVGDVGLAKGVKLGYFAQNQLEYLRSDESPLQHLTRIAPKVLEQQLRDYLGGFGFQGDKVSEVTARWWWCLTIVICCAPPPTISIWCMTARSMRSQAIWKTSSSG
nr:putative ABC transporter ATP-binding protein YheS [Candidatus Pantoea persica]